MTETTFREDMTLRQVRNRRAYMELAVLRELKEGGRATSHYLACNMKPRPSADEVRRALLRLKHAGKVECDGYIWSATTPAEDGRV